MDILDTNIIQIISSILKIEDSCEDIAILKVIFKLKYLKFNLFLIV